MTATAATGRERRQLRVADVRFPTEVTGAGRVVGSW